jgi:hypothetical protein
MIIDADGLFNGNRWRRCSNAARLHAPYLMLVANGYGRIEIDPLRIVARAYATFNPRPTEEDVLAWIREYADAKLLFLYEYDRQTWGQWDTPQRLLAKYKLAADKRSPAPPEPEFSKWKSSYRAASAALPKSCEVFSKSSPKHCENLPSGVGVGDGNGDGIGVGVGDGFDIDCAFEAIWEAYPSGGRTDKPIALSVYTDVIIRTLDREKLHREILDAINGKWKVSKKWADGYVKNLTNYLKGQCWLEDPEPAVTPIPKISGW